MNQLKQAYEHPMFGELNVILLNGKEMFDLHDVAWALGYSRRNSKGVKYLRHDRINNIIEKLDIKTCDHGGHTYIDESGLYDFIFEAGTTRARAFRMWVTSEVLPSIRKHGAYMTPETIEHVLLNPDTIIKLATNLKEEQERRRRAEQQIKLDQPYTNFGKAVSNSDAAINIGAFAKLLYDKHGIRIGRNRLFAWLREKGYLIKHGRERNNPKQKYVEQGLFEARVALINRTQGDVESITTLITGKGQVKIAEELLKEFNVTAS